LKRLALTVLAVALPVRRNWGSRRRCARSDAVAGGLRAASARAQPGALGDPALLACSRSGPVWAIGTCGADVYLIADCRLMIADFYRSKLETRKSQRRRPGQGRRISLRFQNGAYKAEPIGKSAIPLAEPKRESLMDRKGNPWFSRNP
jgi:hypothetical protein